MIAYSSLQNTFERREAQRILLDNPIPIALKSDFNKVIYRNFLMQDYSMTGAWIEFPYNSRDPEYALFPILIHKHQKKYYLYFNMLNYKEIASKLHNVYSAIDNNLWLEIPCEVRRYKKDKNLFGLGLHFVE